MLKGRSLGLKHLDHSISCLGTGGGGGGRVVNPNIVAGLEFLYMGHCCCQIILLHQCEVETMHQHS